MNWLIEANISEKRVVSICSVKVMRRSQKDVCACAPLVNGGEMWRKLPVSQVEVVTEPGQ